MKRIKISDIETDSGTQVRERINDETVAEYAEAMTEGAIFPPVVVFHTGTHYYMGDGFHRLLAAARIGAVDIAADVRMGTAEDALWYALGANRTNGQRLGRGDIRNAVLMALRSFPGKSQVEIARQVGCSVGFVCETKKAVIFTGEIETPAARVNSRGQERPTSYTRKPDDDDSQEQDNQQTRKDDSEKAQKSRGRGVQLANDAIAILQRIPIDDPLRQIGLDTVAKWIKTNR
jgi:ParB-like chromosome segregation protein Spo0J